jgi:hypothetical protein
MPSADQVPVKTPHSTMHWHMWVVLIAGSTGSALRAVRSPNLHITPDGRRDLVYAASALQATRRDVVAVDVPYAGPEVAEFLARERAMFKEP